MREAQPLVGEAQCSFGFDFRFWSMREARTRMWWFWQFHDFCGKISFGAYLTWIAFVFKLDTFKNNVKFGFILKDLF
jgi:hypothetical protein